MIKINRIEKAQTHQLGHKQSKLVEGDILFLILIRFDIKKQVGI